MENLSYNVGYRNHDIDGAGTDAETGYVAGINYTFSPTETLELDTLLEYALLDDAGGVSGDETHYTTANLHGTYAQNWLGVLSWTGRSVNVAAGADSDDDLITATVGYKLRDDMVIEGGYRYADEASVDTSIWGLKFTYNTSFDFGL